MFIAKKIHSQLMETGYMAVKKKQMAGFLINKSN